MSGHAFSSSAKASASVNSSSSAGAAAHAPRPVAKFNNSELVFHIDIILLGILALFFLFALPGAIARFSQGSEWFEGIFFRKITSRVQNTLTRSASSSSSSSSSRLPRLDSPVAITLVRADENYNEKGATGSNESFDSFSAREDVTRQRSTKRLPVQPQNPPTHMPAWSTMLPSVHRFLGYSVRPGYSVGKALLLLVYSGLMLYAGLYKSNPFKNPVRAGMVYGSQLPFIMVLATKNNVIGWLVGCGYEKVDLVLLSEAEVLNVPIVQLNYLHRLVGRFAILAVNVHGIAYRVVLGTPGETQYQMGFIGLIAADVLFLLSTSIVRQVCYPLFYVSHFFMGQVFVLAFVMHMPWSMPYVLAAGTFIMFDRILRMIRSRFTTAHLRALPELGMTRIEVPTINAGWRAGQHVRIKVFSFGMGWFGWAEAHPFTIASVSKGASDEGLVLMCKKAGDWTSKLYELAKREDKGEANGLGPRVRVLIDGPYGGPGHSIMSSFSGAMFVAGGSGITYALGAVRELMQRASEGRTRVKVIELVWSIPDPASLAPLLPLFTNLLKDSEESYTMLRISVSYTRAPSSPEAFAAVQTLPPGLTLSAGRPKLGKILDSVVDHTSSPYGGGRENLGPASGIVAGVCGPLSLGEELAKAVRNIPSERAKAVGGIEVHQEIFGW
ncbi:iron reductase [Amylocystis lapponica]|nr:iron reductase [Amylocystis lapponica]